MTPLGYAAMRRAWCRRALAALLRRWGVYAVVVVVGVSAGASGGLAIAAALAAASVLPLFHAVTLSWAWGGLAVIGQGVAGAGIIWALRPLLLPRRWLEAEHALPIAASDKLRSDAALVGLALLPLFVLYGAGSASTWANDPVWLRPHHGAAAAALLLACAVSAALGVVLLQGRRRPPRTRHVAPRAMRATSWRRWPAVLLWLPLWRGPARRLGAVLGLGALLLCLPSLALARWPQAGAWCLAALAAAALVVATRAATLVGEEITPLLAAAVMLPLPPRRLRRAAALLPLAPLLPAYASLALVLSPARPARPAVLAAFVVASFGAAAVQSLWAAADDETRAARWLLSLAVLLALASEVLA